MIYKSDNGYTGIMQKDFNHWDLSILDKNGKLKYHVKLTEPMSHKDFKREVDDFPLTLEVLNSLCKEDDDGEK